MTFVVVRIGSISVDGGDVDARPGRPALAAYSAAPSAKLSADDRDVDRVAEGAGEQVGAARAGPR